jgi:hypothetical protein
MKVSFTQIWDSIGLVRSFDNLVEKFGWGPTLNSIKSILHRIHPRYWFTAQRGLLVGLGMKEFAAYDGNPMNLMEGVDNSISYNDAKEMIHDNAQDLVTRQVEEGGSTHFLDIDDLALTRSVLIIPKIVAERRKEMAELSIELVEGTTDARAIWFTYYGQRVMHDLGYVPNEKNDVRLRDVVSGLKRAGFLPKIVVKKRKSKNQRWQKVSEGLAHHLELVGTKHNIVQRGISGKPWFLQTNLNE